MPRIQSQSRARFSGYGMLEKVAPILLNLLGKVLEEPAAAIGKKISNIFSGGGYKLAGGSKKKRLT